MFRSLLKIFIAFCVGVAVYINVNTFINIYHEGGILFALLYAFATLGLVAFFGYLGNYASKRRRFESQNVFEAKLLARRREIGEPPSDKLALNAAMCKLIETKGNNKAARKLLEDFAVFLPNRPVKDSFKKRNKNHKNSFWGHTNEMGNIQLSEETGDTTVEKKSTKERVGQFKVWRIRNLVLFQYFLEAELSTMSKIDEAIECYCVHLSARNLSIRGFGKVERVKIAEHGKKSIFHDVVYLQNNKGIYDRLIIRVLTWIRNS